MFNQLFTSRKKSLQAIKQIPGDPLEGITLYEREGKHIVIARLGGHTYRAIHQDKNKARDNAREMLYLHINKELY